MKPNTQKEDKKMKFWIKWTCETENFYYTEVVTEKELSDRLSDNTIRIDSIEIITDN